MALKPEEEKLLDMICTAPHCYNAPMRGLVYCVSCMYGCPTRAPAKAVNLKNRLEREKEVKDAEIHNTQR